MKPRLTPCFTTSALFRVDDNGWTWMAPGAGHRLAREEPRFPPAKLPLRSGRVSAHILQQRPPRGGAMDAGPRLSRELSVPRPLLGPAPPPTSAPAERNWGHRGGAGGWSVFALRMLNEGQEGPSHTEATAEGQVTTKGRLPLEGCPTMEDGHPQKRGQRLDRGQQLQGPSSAPSGRGCAVPPSGHLWAPPGARAGSRGAARSGHRKQPGPPPPPPPRPPRMLQTRSSCLRSRLGARARTDRSRIRSC